MFNSQGSSFTSYSLVVTGTRNAEHVYDRGGGEQEESEEGKCDGDSGVIAKAPKRLAEVRQGSMLDSSTVQIGHSCRC